MGKRTVVMITDDYSGQELAETEAVEVTLTLVMKRPGDDGQGDDGQGPSVRRWELVYSPDSADKLDLALKPFIDGVPEETPSLAAVTKPAGTGGSSGGPTPRNTHARAWWKGLTPANRMSLGNLPEFKDRGRIPEPVLTAYDSVKPEGHIPAKEGER
jgi:hypothetical protein